MVGAWRSKLDTGEQSKEVHLEEVKLEDGNLHPVEIQ